MPSLTRTEAAARAALLTVQSYEIELDLTGGAEVFRSSSTIRFRADPAAGDGTFVELKPARLYAARLNGQPLDPAALTGDRLPLTGLREDANELVVEADMAYSNTGEGVHRFVDPADGETYLYAMSFLDDTHRIFACFDQPDLKAPVTLTVAAPMGWEVAANGAVASRVGPGRWRFATTEPLATYVLTFIAGPYHVCRDEHDGIPLALYCRRSLATDLDKDSAEIFEITKACLDQFHALFGVRYPFGKYDQAFVPEFNAGAMENPGLVTIRDDYVFRSAVTDTEREQRATVIAHEMAHMWFGDLVTMRWWDDLWLNESFAEYMGTRVTAEATRFRNAWTTFAIKRKSWGYAADQRPSTHPVAPTEVGDTAQALLNFDGISYAKGASVLRQLVAWVGDEAFLAGLRAHFDAHRFGNATLADLLAHLSRSSGRDLAAWAQVWLRHAQVNTLHAEVEVDAAGRYGSVAVRQTAPPAHPVLRPHRVGIGLYDLVGAAAVRRQWCEADLDPAVHDGQAGVPALVGLPAADFLLLNDGDLTYAKVRFDAASAAAVPRILPVLDDPLARAVVWASVLDAVRDAQWPVADLVALVGAALPAETEVVVVEDVLSLTRALVDRYVDPPARAAAMAALAQTCAGLLAGSAEGGSVPLAAARGLIAATTDADLLRGWLDGPRAPAGLAVDSDLRWRLTYRLAVLGAAGESEIAAELAHDRSATGEQRATQCRAALPDPAAKALAWRALIEDTTLSNRLLESTAQGFWQPEQATLMESYVARYFAEMPAAAARRTAWLGERLAAGAFPSYAVAESTRRAAAELLARPDLAPNVRRAVTDADDELGRALTARARAAHAAARSRPGG
ncbi:MAG TPA: aminopeptidase N [Pilimelia sp.]|nr:aminopeptidase N [Pilimelia sp.]